MNRSISCINLVVPVMSRSTIVYIRMLPAIIRKILQIRILLLLSYISSNACDCPIRTFTEVYTQSDFVAEIRITKNYDDEGEQELYKAEIQNINSYKGDSVNAIYEGGKSDGKMGSSCSIYIHENTELIAYANSDGD